jgi:hypothetical protein
MDHRDVLRVQDGMAAAKAILHHGLEDLWPKIWLKMTGWGPCSIAFS